MGKVWEELQVLETDRKAWSELDEDLCPINIDEAEKANCRLTLFSRVECCIMSGSRSRHSSQLHGGRHEINSFSPIDSIKISISSSLMDASEDVLEDIDDEAEDLSTWIP